MKCHNKIESIGNQILENYKYIDGKIFIKKHSQKRRIGKELAGYVDKSGYVIVSINNTNFKKHRIIFFLVNGYLPKMIDHIDGNRGNNKIENLRACNSSLNNANAIYKKGMYSKLAGVSWHKHHKLFTSSIKKDGKTINLGYFKSEEEAHEKYKEKHKEIYGDYSVFNR